MKAEDWIKVTDRLPEIGEEVLVAYKTKQCGDVGFRMGHRVKWRFVTTDKNDFALFIGEEMVTHWMPIVPPKEDSGLLKPFKDGDIISNGNFIAIFYKMADSHMFYHCWYNKMYESFRLKIDSGIGCVREYSIATEEEKQKLFEVIDKNGYKWNAETNRLEGKNSLFNQGDILVSRSGDIVLCSYVDNKQIVHPHCKLDGYGTLIIHNDKGLKKESNYTLAGEEQKRRLLNRLKSSKYKYNSVTNRLEEWIEQLEGSLNN